MTVARKNVDDHSNLLYHHRFWIKHFSSFVRPLNLSCQSLDTKGVFRHSEVYPDESFCRTAFNKVLQEGCILLGAASENEIDKTRYPTGRDIGGFRNGVLAKYHV